jgi:hypothetical protein
MTKKPGGPPDEAKTTMHKRKSRSSSDFTFAAPRGLSVSTSEAAAAEAYYTSEHASESEHPSQLGGKGAEMLGLTKPPRSNPRKSTPDGGQLDPHRHVHVLSHELLQNLPNPSPDAIALAEGALAFCKECRGWKDATSVNDFGYPYISESVTKKLASTTIPPYERHFHYTHLDKVMAAVQDWLVTAPVTRGDDRMIAARSMRDACSTYFDGLMDQPDLCRNLMAACVEANRTK